MFPSHILGYQESPVLLNQLTFIDYQLSLLVQNEIGTELVPASHANPSAEEKLVQLANYANNVSVNHSDVLKSAHEAFYEAILHAHIHYLGSDMAEMGREMSKATYVEGAFPGELHVRYAVLKGLAENNSSVWVKYLSTWKPFKKSEIVGRKWVDLLFGKLAQSMSRNGAEPIVFSDLKTHGIVNEHAVIAFACYLLRDDKFSAPSLRTEFANYLSDELEMQIGTKVNFPNAREEHSALSEYVENLYLCLSQVPQAHTVLKPTLTKKYLISAISKTFQCQATTAAMIKCLIQLNEHDEALAAFETYVAYVENAQRQHGEIDLLSVVDVYATCIYLFNPLKSSPPHKPRKFKHMRDEEVVQAIRKHSVGLVKFLEKASQKFGFSYYIQGDIKGVSEDNPISFLYHKYNPHVVLPDTSQLIEIMSKGWFSLGYLSYYLSAHGVSEETEMKAHVENVLRHYKNALIVNSTGNATYLFNYALALSLARELKPALKLTKFILKKYPESFKTWNLMVLLLSAMREKSTDGLKIESFDTSPLPTQPNGAQMHADLSDAERFINNALNIAGLFMVKHRQQGVKLTVEAKYEILQLKLTQMAVWEHAYGTQYILESLSEVFILYHELFAVELETPKSEPKPSVFIADNKWSHRPSVMDPSPDAAAVVLENGALATKPEGTERIKRISKLAAKKDRLGSLRELGRRNSKRAPKRREETKPSSSVDHAIERKILQNVWLWTSAIYRKVGLLEEAEQCIVEAETVYEPNVKTFTALGLLTTDSRKFLSLQEYERSLELLARQPYNKADYGTTLFGLCNLLLNDDPKNSVFISEIDKEAGIVRMKNLLEEYVLCWPFGSGSSEAWYFLSKIYDVLDDDVLLEKALWRCVELEDQRGVRGYGCCDSFYYEY